VITDAIVRSFSEARSTTARGYVQYFASGMYRMSGSGSGQNGTRYRISQPDNDWSFCVSSPI